MNSLIFLISTCHARKTTLGVKECNDVYESSKCESLIPVEYRHPDSDLCTNKMESDNVWLWDMCPKTCQKCPRDCHNLQNDCFEIMDINDDLPDSEACKSGTYNRPIGSPMNGRPLSEVCPVNCMTCHKHVTTTTTTTTQSTEKVTTQSTEKVTTETDDGECKDAYPPACQSGNLTKDQCANGYHYESDNPDYHLKKLKVLCAKSCSKYETIGNCIFDDSIPDTEEGTGETCFDAWPDACPDNDYESNPNSTVCSAGTYYNPGHKWDHKSIKALCQRTCKFCVRPEDVTTRAPGCNDWAPQFCQGGNMTPWQCEHEKVSAFGTEWHDKPYSEVCEKSCGICH